MDKRDVSDKRRVIALKLDDENWQALDVALARLMVPKGLAVERLIVWFLGQPHEEQRKLLEKANEQLLMLESTGGVPTPKRRSGR